MSTPALSAPTSARAGRQNARAMGRPSKATRPRLAKLCALLASGCTRAVAAKRVGIHDGTLRRWVRRSPTLAAQLEEAEARFEVAALSAVVDAAFEPAHWTAAAWLLERRFPSRWGRARLRLRAAPEDAAPSTVTVYFGGRNVPALPEGERPHARAESTHNR